MIKTNEVTCTVVLEMYVPFESSMEFQALEIQVPSGPSLQIPSRFSKGD